MLKFKEFSKIEELPTPFWYYDIDLLRRTVDEVAALSRRYGIGVHYALKANVEPRILQYISSKGIGADCVSGNEVEYASEHDFKPESIVFAGVGKTDYEISRALELGIGTFNVESLMEMEVIDALASAKGVRANVSVRINPNVDAHTHKFITTGLDENKFGISRHEFDSAIELIKNSKSLCFKGLHFHIGSQITDVEAVYGEECRRASEIVRYFEERGLIVHDIDLGGGLGVDYTCPDEALIPDFAKWFSTIDSELVRRHDQTVSIEPGRSMVAQCGSLISRVLFVKHGERKSFLILDAGMNDLIRPALYGAYHKIENLTAAYLRATTQPYADGKSVGTHFPSCGTGGEKLYDLTGPVCESSDVWGTDRELPESFRGDVMAIRSAGAYGSVMSSRYNLRNIAPAVFSDDLTIVNSPIFK